ncbi:sensor histidine kinase [Bombilactobacillus bombi]|uniref:histidine kinase n=1 Tax=Bombilactobacillus bombi TaxID=1303590 RepID=A0A3R6UU90_9LACO|nr:sensor histidine kinase [Bombilactobacillus bombi]RHW45052.1 sensor histidine kinase [Bombilactobacillus bombi]
MSYWQIVIKQWPLGLGYVILVGFLGGIFGLYDVSWHILIDIVRYTWFIVVAVILLRASYQKHQIQQLNQLRIQKSMPRQNFNNPVLQAYSQTLHEVQQEYLNSQQHLEQQQLEQQNYLLTWSHEMKTPLMALMSLADSQTLIPSAQVQQQIVLIQNKIDLLLNYERLADFNHDLNFEWVQLQALVTPIIQKYAIFFANKHLRLQNFIGEIKLLTDAKWLTVVLEQIIFNAIKYSQPQQQITIKVLKNQLFIQDEGIGIASSDLPRVFEPGFTGHNGREQQIATGMGLYIAHQICQRLEIQLSIASQKGRGTTVKLTFPHNHVR